MVHREGNSAQIPYSAEQLNCSGTRRGIAAELQRYFASAFGQSDVRETEKWRQELSYDPLRASLDFDRHHQPRPGRRWASSGCIAIAAAVVAQVVATVFRLRLATLQGPRKFLPG